MISKRLGLAALLALFLVCLPALAFTTDNTVNPVNHHAVGWLVLVGLAGIAGTVVNTYKYPGSGTTPATAAQATGVHVQVAQVSFADADTTATVTHNYNLGTTGATPNTGQLFPEVTLVWTTAGTAAAQVDVTWTDGNSITLTKRATSTGTGGTVAVYMRRPHSLGQ